MNRFLLLLCALLALSIAVSASAQAPLRPGEKAMSVRLIAETDAPAAGGKVELALLMTPKPGWHGYWNNSVTRASRLWSCGAFRPELPLARSASPCPIP